MTENIVLNPIEQRIKNGISPLIAFLTMATCGDGCWHAIEKVCRCSCNGKNHGIMNNGGGQPKRTAKIDGELFDLVGVIPSLQTGECWNDVYLREQKAQNEVIQERFPGIDKYAYGEYREGKIFPVVSRKISASQRNWFEVSAIPKAWSLIWARPLGSKYLIRGNDYKANWTEYPGKSIAKIEGKE